MSWKNEIFRAFFVALGTFEVISNSIFMTRKKGMELAVKQHQELPANLKPIQIKVKVICMLIFGALFLMTGLYSYFTHSFHDTLSASVLISFAVYAIIEAGYYRYWRTICFSCISTFVLLLFLFIS